MNNDKRNKKHSRDKFGKGKPYQELNKSITDNNQLKDMQPTPQPKDFEEIEY